MKKFKENLTVYLRFFETDNLLYIPPRKRIYVRPIFKFQIFKFQEVKFQRVNPNGG